MRTVQDVLRTFVSPTWMRGSNAKAPIPGLRDAFRVWSFYTLARHPEAPFLVAFLLTGPVGDIMRPLSNADDTTLIAHIAPLAKVYGFCVVLASLEHVERCTIEVHHDYKEYYGDDGDELDPDDQDMEDSTVHMRWTFRTMGGRRLDELSKLAKMLEKHATKLVEEEKYVDINARSIEDDIEHVSSLECIDDSVSRTLGIALGLDY